MSHEHHKQEANPRQRPAAERAATAPSAVLAKAGPSAPPAHAGNAAMATVLARQGGGDGSGPLDPGIGALIDRERGGGQALPTPVRVDMEQRLGTDFSAVRVHTGPRAQALNAAVQAEAFATGTDIFFGAGHHDPASAQGRELLAHELTHVVQQASGTGGPAGRVSHPDDPAEVEARAVGREVATSARPTTVETPPGGPIATSAADRVANPAHLLQMQRSAGNAAVSRLMRPQPPAPAYPRPGAETRDAPAHSGAPTEAPPSTRDDGTAPASAEQARVGAGPFSSGADDSPPPGAPPSDADRDPSTVDGRPASGAGPAAARAVRLGSTMDDRSATDPAPAHAGTGPAVPGKEAARHAAGPGPGPAPGAPAAAQRDADGDEPAAEPDAAEAGSPAAAPAAMPGPAPAPPPVANGDPMAEPVAAAAVTGEGLLAQAEEAATAEIGQALEVEGRSLDETADAQRARIAAIEKQGRQKVRASVRAATEALRTQGATQRARLAAAQVDQQTRARSGVVAAATQVRTNGAARGEEAVAIAGQKSDALRVRVGDQAGKAERMGRERGAAARDDNDDAVVAMRRAATEVAGQTATEIRAALGTTADDLRNVGPEVRADISRQSAMVAAELTASLGPLSSALGDNAAHATAGLDQVLAQGMAALADTGVATAAALARIRRTSLASLKTSQATARQAMRSSADQSLGSVRGYGAAMRVAGRGMTDAVLAELLNRTGRRRISRAMAEEAAAQLQRNYGMSAQQATVAGQQIAAAFRTSAAALSQVLVEVGDTAGKHTEAATGHAGKELAGARLNLVKSLQHLVDEAVARGEERLAASDQNLQTRLAGIDTGLGGALRGLGTELDARIAQTAGNTGKPLTDLGSRMHTAMERARDEANDGWLLTQLKSIGEALSDPGFWAGLIVGLLVTIAVVAICGTGIGALILAGALAGAASVAATTFTDHLTGKRQGPIDWGTLGKDMLVGAAFGAVGGAVGAGTAAGVLGRQVLTGAVQATARQVVVNRLAQVVVGTSMGVVQNVLQGPGTSVWDPGTWNWGEWDRGLLLNVAINSAMSTKTAEKAIGHLAETARAGAVDSGVALNVTPAEKAASAIRADSRADAAPAGDRNTEPVPASERRTEPMPAVADQDARPVPGTKDPDGAEWIDLDKGDFGMLDGAEATDPAANRRFFEDFIRDQPTREAALLRNDTTGEHIVVQGDEGSVPVHLRDPDELVPPHLKGKGRWVIEAHSHPVHPAVGHTPEFAWVPSGADADFGIITTEAVRRNRPFYNEIRLETAKGPDVTKFGYEPGAAQPYVIDKPTPRGGREVLRFATIEDYHDWFRTTWGGDMRAVPDWFSGARRAPAQPLPIGGPPPMPGEPLQPVPAGAPDLRSPGAEPAASGTGHTEADLGDNHGLTVHESPGPELTGAPPALNVELDRLRQDLADYARRSGPRREQAARLRAALDEMVARGNVEGVRLTADSIRDALANERVPTRGETMALSFDDPDVRAAFHHEMTDNALAGQPGWDAYRDLVIDRYEAMGTLDVGQSPRSSDGGHVAATGELRARFLEALETGGLLPEVADAIHQHLRRAVREAGSEAGAVAAGDAAWVNRLTGERVAGPGPDIVLWPADPIWGVFRVDHIVELQHGGVDAAENYVAAPQRMHAVKSEAMNRFGLRFAG